MNKTTKNIQQTGPVGLKGIRKSDLYPSPTGDVLRESIRINKRAQTSNVDPSALSDIGIMHRSAETEQGKSMFDDPIMINPTPETIGGIPVGSTFSNKTMKELWDMLLYKYLAPAFSSFSISGFTFLYLK